MSSWVRRRFYQYVYEQDAAYCKWLIEHHKSLEMAGMRDLANYVAWRLQTARPRDTQAM